MIKNKLFFLFVFQFLFNNFLYADTVAFIDIEKLINESNIGKLNIKSIKTENEKNNDFFKKSEDGLRKEEQKLIAQKKILSPDEYSKVIKEFQVKINNNNLKKKEKLSLLKKKSFNFKEDLMNAANPIIAEYAKKNSYSMVIPRKYIILGKKEVDITKNIIEIIDKTKIDLN